MPITTARLDGWNHQSNARLVAGHFSTGFRATATGLDAYVHAAEPFAISRTFLADLGAFGACMPMMGCIQEHEVRRCPADLSAGHHERHVAFLDVGASHCQAMVHRCRYALAIASEAIVDAGPHRVGVCMVHVTLLDLG